MQLKRIYFFCLIVPLIFSSTAFTQTKAIDNLHNLLKNAQQDTTKINLQFQLALELSGYNETESRKYLETGYKLARLTENKFYTAKYFLTKGKIFYDLAKYDTSSINYDAAIAMYSELINSTNTETETEIYKIDKADCMTGKGLILSKVYKYQESIQNYLEAIASIENLKGKNKNNYLATLYADIASNYYELEQFENALNYDKRGLLFIEMGNNTDTYIIGHLFVADDFSALSQFDSSSVYLEKVRFIVLQLNKPNLNIRYYYILGGIHRKKKEWSKALASYKKANEAAKQMKDNFQMINSEEGIAACYLNTGNLIKAREFALHVLIESTKINIPFLKGQALQLLAEVEEKTGNIDLAYQYQKKFIALSDSVKKEKVQRLMNEIEAKYQTEKKQKEILQLQKDKLSQSLSIKQKSTLNYFLVGTLVALFLVSFLGYRNLRHRQQLAKQQDELQQQRIRELEKDKLLVAVDSMLKGQEEERSRLAKDLHDGLGGLLSGVKFSLSNMKDNLIITHENMTVFERSLDMLDTSINELRRVAHNMMPELLTKFGLDEALKEYCNSINTTNLLAVKYQSIGLGTRIEKSSEIIIYRIIQELLNNIMKHAAATEAMVQLIKDENRFSIIVEDNGKGFDTAILKMNKGAGITSIQSRVDYLKGQLDVHSEQGKGTLVNIEFKI